MATLIGYDKNINFNNGLGFWPTSLFIELTVNGDKCEYMNNLYGLYDDICNQGCHDLIFFGDIKAYKEDLLWLLPRLVAELYIISLLLPINELIPLPARRIILTTDYEMFRKNSVNVDSLGENDIIVLEERDFGKFKWLRNHLIKTFRGKIFFNENCYSKSYIVNSNIYDLFPVRL